MTGHELAMALRRTYLAMHRSTDAAVTRHGVTADQFVLLSALADGQVVTQRELSGRTASDKNTVRAMLLLLEKRGLITRPPHPTDGRARAVTLTTAGRRIYRSLWAATERVRTALTEAVVPDSPETMLDLFDRLTRAMTLLNTRKARS